MNGKLLFLSILFTVLNSIALISQTITGTVVDSENSTPLVFATVSFSETGGCFTNEDGKFAFEAQDSPGFIIVSYIGYATDTIELSASVTDFEVRLKPATAALPDIEVVADQQDYLSRLFWSCVKTSKRQMQNRNVSKVFRRTYSRRDGKPVELMEGFYNARTVDGHLESLELKNGRYGLPANDYVMNIDLGFLFEQFSLFDPYIDKLPQQPFSSKSRKKLKETYTFSLINVFPQGQDTVVVIQFVPEDAGNAFEGKAYFSKTTFTLHKLQLETKHFEKHSFRTMEETDKSQIPRLAINMTAKFAEEPSGKVRFDLLTAEFDMRVEQPRRSYDFNSQSRLVFYDYDSPFSMPLFDAPKTISDYQQIQYTPYRTALWEKDQFIAPSENAKAFIDQLETRKLFINAAPNVRIKYVDYRYDYYRPGWEIDTELTCNMPCVPAPPLAEEDVLNLTSADPYDSIYVKTQLYLDYDLEGDSLQFFTAAMIDYQFSYIVAPSPVKTKLAAGYLKLADYYAQQLKKELSTCCSSFSRSKNFQVQEKLDEYNKKLDKAINEYHSGVNKRNKTKALKNWTEKLEALEGKE